MKLTDLLSQKAELEKQIAQIQHQERADAVAQVRTLMNQYGLSLSDISAKAAPGARAGAKAMGSRAGSKVAAKFHNPATGESWSGRGLKPKWLTAALASGRVLGDFAV
jgi:DNA-binding protein H-NS